MNEELRSPELTLHDASATTIPQIGFGTFQIPADRTQQAVEQALEIGYRHIDTAAAYYNEEAVGAALKATGMAGKVFVATKLRNCDQGYEQALIAFEESRRKLGVDAIDMYLIHWPMPRIDAYRQTWKALLKLRDEGAIRVAGVSNFLPEHLEVLKQDSGELPAVNQIELHPSYSQPMVREYCAANGIAVEAWSPLGHGGDMSAEPVLAAAAAHGVTPAQVVLRWHTQSGRIIIPKSSHSERMRTNLASASFDLTAEELADIDALHTESGRIGADPVTYVQSQSWADQKARGNV